MEGHGLDWGNQPNVFKEYPEVSFVSLPEPGTFPKKRISEVLRQKERDYEGPAFDIGALSALLFLTYGLTGKARQGNGYFYFRCVPSAGALYPAELYLASNSLAGLDDGLYHFSVADHGLHALRRGCFQRTVPPESSLTFFLSAIFFRSCWKYRDRGYRYCLLDTGHLLQNLLLAARFMGADLSWSADFPDDQANRFLGLDGEREVCLAAARLSQGKEPQGVTIPVVAELPRTMVAASRVARKEAVYSGAVEAHRAGMFAPGKKEASPAAMIQHLGPIPKRWEKPGFTASSWPELVDYKDAVLSRRSKRNFVRESLPGAFFDALLESLQRAASEHGLQCVGTGVLMHAVEGRKPCYALLDLARGNLGVVKEGSFIESMAHICLDQSWLANAALHFVFMADLSNLETWFGPRGYRSAMLEAGRMGEMLYLSAASMGVGCCGIGAFYDEEARQMLELGDDVHLLYLVAVGPVKRA